MCFAMQYEQGRRGILNRNSFEMLNDIGSSTN